jgi:glycosyltransferase involved in cell wall biosynthesis
MTIGFDAKRAFFNRSGLGNYSRDLITSLSRYYAQNQYVLYTPKPKKSRPFYNSSNIILGGPETFYQKLLPALWRSKGICGQLKKDDLQIYHGLSNELPKGINKTGIRSVVTIHDLIFLRYPEFYKPIDRKIYELKFRHAAQQADTIIAISNQTKKDIVEFLGVTETKIEVVYQACNNIFWAPVKDETKKDVLKKYGVPEQFLLYVGSIEERKNLLNIVKAIHTHNIKFPLVVVGKPTMYLNRVKAYIERNQVKDILFLHDVLTEELPAFYQMAKIFIYPSLFEGFGIPILEALTSKTPVITSKDGCFPEAGGKSSIYVDPANADELAIAIKTVLGDSALRDSMIIDGYIHAQQFKQEKIAKSVMEVYEKVIS